MFIITFLLSIVILTISLYFASSIIWEKIDIRIALVIAVAIVLISSILWWWLISSVIWFILWILVLMKVWQFELVSALLIAFVASAINYWIIILLAKFFS